MKGLTKMLMMNREKRNERGYDYDSFSHEYYPRDDWGAWIEGRFRDDRGREHYDNGRYAPMRNEYMPPVYKAVYQFLNCTPFVRQYGILSNKWGVLLCQREYRTNDTQRNSRSW